MFTSSIFRAPILESYPNPFVVSLSESIRDLNNPRIYEDLGVYVTTNEMGQAEIAALLQKQPILKNSCHIGFSGWHNFDIMAQRQSAFGVICDFNPQNKDFIDQTIKILDFSKTRDDFVQELLLYIQATSPLLYSLNFDSRSIEDEITGELKRPGSWLSSDQTFGWIQTLAKNDNIVAITEDIRSSATFHKLAGLIKEHDFVVDTLYLSNICYYIPKKDRPQFIETIQTLALEDTLVINCPDIIQENKPRSLVAPPKQLVLSGAILKQTPAFCFAIHYQSDAQ